MANSRRRSTRPPVFQRGPDSEINTSALPKLVASDGSLHWAPADDNQEQEAEDVTATESARADSQLGPVTEAEQAVIAANRTKIEELKTQPRGVDELEFGDLLRIVACRSSTDVGLAVAGLALQVCGLVPITLWESAVTAASGAAGLALHRTRQGAPMSLQPPARRVPMLWRTHPDFVMGILINVLHGIAQAALVDDTELENQLDAFYPQWSRTDFEFDLRQYFR